jgi:hypothetical protein
MAILVTSPGFEVIANGKKRTIQLPYLKDLLIVDEKQRRVKSDEANSLWNPRMWQRVEEFENGEMVDLAMGWQVRFGCSAAVITKKGIPLVKFSPTHPNNPNRLTPPAGIYEPETGLPEDAAFKELTEEVIIKRGSALGIWVWQKQVSVKKENVFLIVNETCILSYEWVRAYAKAKGYTLSEITGLGRLTDGPMMFVEQMDITDSSANGKWVYFQFGDDPTSYDFHCVWGLAAFEPKTGSIEIIVPFKLSNLSDPSVELLDGEKLPNGSYRGNEIVFADKAMLETPNLLTTKARAIIEAFC